MIQRPPAFAETDPRRDALLARSALDLARGLREGELRSAELVDLCLDRIARHDGTIGAFVGLRADAARREAEAKDRQRAKGGPLPPFHGVPIAVKDLHLLRGMFARMGSRAWRHLWSPIDDVTVKALRRAGFVIVGKTSTSELALMPFVETDIHPPTRNPWNPEHISGGSSGGAAAAVAAGLIPVSPGSDGGGSIRIPASMCGLFGLKTTRGRVPNPHKGVDPNGMAVLGPIARSVDDAAALADAMCFRDPADPGSWLSAARKPPKPGLRIALWLVTPLGHPADEPQATAAREVAARLEALGHTVAPLPPVGATLAEFLPIYQRIFARTPVLFESKLQPVTAWFRAEGRRHSDADVKRAFDTLAARAEAALADFDLLISPTVPLSPPRVGQFAHLPPREMFEAAAPIGAFTAAWNVTGRPALTVPWGQDPLGLPRGVQIVGRRDADELVLAVGRSLFA